MAARQLADLKLVVYVGALGYRSLARSRLDVEGRVKRRVSGSPLNNDANIPIHGAVPFDNENLVIVCHSDRYVVAVPVNPGGSLRRSIPGT